jgi:hypothetical protein
MGVRRTPKHENEASGLIGFLDAVIEGRGPIFRAVPGEGAGAQRRSGTPFQSPAFYLGTGILLSDSSTI